MAFIISGIRIATNFCIANWSAVKPYAPRPSSHLSLPSALVILRKQN